MIVFIGAGLGGACRHGVNLGALRLLGTGLPAGTLIVNLLGCFALGLLAEWLALRGDLPQATRLLLATGFLGGFTTFSTFALDALTMWDSGRHGVSLLYGAGSVILSIGALVAGLAFVRAFGGEVGA